MTIIIDGQYKYVHVTQISYEDILRLVGYYDVSNDTRLRDAGSVTDPYWKITWKNKSGTKTGEVHPMSTVEILDFMQFTLTQNRPLPIPKNPKDKYEVIN